MTVNEFINECNNFEYSKEYFDLYKEEQELNNLSVYMQSSYYTESSVENQKVMLEKKEEKESGFFRKIYEKVVSLFKNFWKWIKKFIFGFEEKSPAKQIQNDFEDIQEDIEKLKELGKRYYEDPSMYYKNFLNEVASTALRLYPSKRHTLLHNTHFENPTLRRTLRNVKHYEKLYREIQEKGLPLWFLDVCEIALSVPDDANQPAQLFFEIDRKNIPPKYDTYHILDIGYLLKELLGEKGPFRMEWFARVATAKSKTDISVKIGDKNAMERYLKVLDDTQQNLENALKEKRFSHISTRDLSILTKYIHSTIMFYRDVYMELMKDMKYLKRIIRVGIMAFGQPMRSLKDGVAPSDPTNDPHNRSSKELIENEKKNRTTVLKTYKNTFGKGE